MYFPKLPFNSFSFFWNFFFSSARPLFVLLPSLSIWGLGSCRDAWIVVSSGQVVYSFQRVLGSEVKLSPVCCCLTDTPLQSNPFGFFTHCVLQVEHLLKKKKKFVESKENSEMWSCLDLICWLCVTEHINMQTNMLTHKYMCRKHIKTVYSHACSFYTHTMNDMNSCIPDPQTFRRKGGEKTTRSDKNVLELSVTLLRSLPTGWTVFSFLFGKESQNPSEPCTAMSVTDVLVWPWAAVLL